MEKTKYLIIGNGIAGLSAGREIRNNDLVGTITMISTESYLSYYRVKLTEALATNVNLDEFLINKESWYEEKKIKVLLNKLVEKLDVENSFIVLDDGEKLYYEKLLIATGSNPFIPPIKGTEKEGVFTLRTIKDLNNIKKYFENCQTITVIGGGLLGLEAAWSLKQIGKRVKVLEFAPSLLPKQLDKELGEKLAQRLIGEGIDIYLPKSADEILGETKVSGIKINGGEIIETDGVLISSGIRPNLSLVRGTTIKFEKGIKTNKHLRTNLENIYAAGDVVEVDGVIVGLWTTSNEQGKIAGANMSGKEIEYLHPKLFSTLKIGNIEVFSAGDILDYDRVYEYKEENNDIHHILYVKDGKIKGVNLFGKFKDLNSLRNAVFNNKDINEYLKKGLPFK